MKHKGSSCAVMAAVVLCLCGWGYAIEGGNSATGPAAWPRTFTSGEHSLLVYQPQVDSWDNFARIKWRAAVAVATGDNAPEYGVLVVNADTLVDHEARLVIMSSLDIDVRFSGASPERERALKAITKECLPQKEDVTVSLDAVLAYMNHSIKPRTADVNLKPPPIFHSESPAILVVYLGQPQFKPIPDTKLMFAVNTNWAILMDIGSGRYYLQDDKSWLTSTDPIQGPWTAADTLPASFSKLPDNDQWKDARAAMPPTPSKGTPKVFVSTEPAELIVTEGEAQFTPISGTRLMYVSNPAMPVFLDLLDGSYYYLVAGRWFTSTSLDGPWTSASASLPAEFAKIPPDSDMGFVLTSIPKTQEAQDAILLASVPHKATFSIKDTKLEVAYDGAPQFEPIQGTSMSYAVNTAYQVVMLEGMYYCCYRGAWFVSAVPAGPWVLCTSVPAAIYTIPPASPLYNTTYVQVYNVTDDSVVYGYTAGYSGEYVAATGALMFGAGFALGASVNWYQYNPCYYSYGCAVHYSYAYGGYYRAGGWYYGPYGGAGWGSVYNPATGAWGRAGYMEGPNGERWGAEAYNPFTNTYAGHAGGTNGYQSWGKTVVAQDGDWARAGHVSNQSGAAAGYAANSSGKWAAGAKTGNGGGVIKTSGGDVYAGKDGNVYKKSDGQWQKYNGNGGWEDPTWNKPAPAAQPSNNDNRWSQRETARSLDSDSWARDRGNSNTSSSWQRPDRDFGSDRFEGGDRGGGGSRWGGGGRFGGGGGGFRGRR